MEFGTTILLLYRSRSSHTVRCGQHQTLFVIACITDFKNKYVIFIFVYCGPKVANTRPRNIFVRKLKKRTRRQPWPTINESFKMLYVSEFWKKNLSRKNSFNSIDSLKYPIGQLGPKFIFFSMTKLYLYPTCSLKSNHLLIAP